MILVRYVLLLGVLFFVQVTAKAAFIDSVAYYKKQLHNPTTPIDLKIKTYYNLYNFYETSHPSKATYYFNRGYFLSQKYDSKYGKGWYYKIKAYNELTASNFQKGIQYGKTAAHYFKTINDTINYIESNYYTAFGLQLIQQRIAAKQLLLLSLKTLPSNRFYKQQGMLYSSLSYLENDHDLVQSLDYLLKSKNAFLKTKDKKLFFSIYNDLSLFYTSIEDFESAYLFTKKSFYWVKIAKPVNYYDVATVASNLAVILIAKNKFRLALFYANQAIINAEKIDNKEFVQKGLLLKIQIYLSLNEFKKARLILNTIQSTHLDAMTYFKYNLLMVQLNLKKGKLLQVKSYLSICDSLNATNISLTKQIQLTYFETRISYFKKIGQNSKVAEALTKYYLLKIDQLEQQKDFRLIQLQLKALNVEKHFAHRALQLQKQKTSAISESKYYERFYFMISGFFLIVLLFFISWSVIIYRKRNKQLREFNTLLETLVAEKEVLLQEIHHRVKNNFQIITSILSIQSRQKDTTIASFLTQFSSRVHSMAFVHDKLFGNKLVGEINARQFLDELVGNSCAAFPNQQVAISHTILGDDLTLTSTQLLPIGIIVNELTVNALKYAFPHQPEGVITIAMEQKETFVQLLFTDNGIGKKDISHKNTGLIVVDAFVMKLKGCVEVTNEDGLTYRFEFPTIDMQKEVG